MFFFKKNAPEFKPSYSANAPPFTPQPTVPAAPLPNFVQQTPFMNNNYGYGYAQPMQPMGFFNNMGFDYMGNSFMPNVKFSLFFFINFSTCFNRN